MGALILNVHSTCVCVPIIRSLAEKGTVLEWQARDSDTTKHALGGTLGGSGIKDRNVVKSKTK